jgi:hypothetical protein
MSRPSSISASLKSACVSRRLSRTLKRPGISFRPIEDEDVKYAGAAWKLGAFKGLNPVFDREMTPAEFRETFIGIVQSVGAAWTVLADGPKGKRPIGFVFGIAAGKVITLTRVVPMPWSTMRQRVQGFIAWLNAVRREYIVFEYARHSERRFWEHVCRYGAMRRVGTILDMEDEPIALFQSRKP